MIVLVLIATAWIRFSAPAYKPIVNSPGCNTQGATPETLSTVKLYSNGVLSQSHAIAAGVQDSFLVSVPGDHCVAVTDLAGNESCQKCVTLTTDVPPPPLELGPGRREYFDLAGRRVRLPLERGIYWERVIGTRLARKIVVVR